MEYKVSVDEKLGIINSVSVGDWNITDSNKVTKEIIDASEKYNIRRILIDHGKLKINISRYMAFKRPSELKSQFEDIQERVAFISPRRRHKLYQFFSLVAQNRGIQFKSFKRQQDALDWLQEGNT